MKRKNNPPKQQALGALKKLERKGEKKENSLLNDTSDRKYAMQGAYVSLFQQTQSKGVAQR